MIDDRNIQKALRASGHYTGLIDGDFGPKSRAAVRAAVAERVPDSGDWSNARVKDAYQQIMMTDAGLPVGKIDGLVGPQTLYALELWQNLQRDKEESPDAVAWMPNTWPRQKDVPAFFGEVGKHQVKLKLPYPMKLAWNQSKVIPHFSVHEKVHDSLKRILQRTLDHYGPEKIKALNLDQFGGCLNVRKMKGGSKYSMHSWGIAVDIDPAHNRYRWGKDKAHLARRSRADFVGFWEDEGWLSLGRARNFDWMHFQAARL